MDRIETYVNEAFAKFKDLPEIRAQKEEMSDHLRDRIRDAVSQGKSEKDAFEVVTADYVDSMADLEQSLSEFLRDEYRQENVEKRTPGMKEIYINFYRYHRAVLIVFAELAIFFLLSFIGAFHGAFSLHDLTPKGFAYELNLEGMLTVAVFVLSIHAIVSIIRYAWNPYAKKTLQTNSLSTLGKFPFWEIGVVVGFPVGFIVFVNFFNNAQYYRTPFFDLVFMSITEFFTCFAIFYVGIFVLFFVLNFCLDFQNDGRYDHAPEPKQDLPLIKIGLVVIAVTMPILFFRGFCFETECYRTRNENEDRIRNLSEDISHLHVVKRELSNTNKNLRERIRALEAALDREKELYTGAPGQGKNGLDKGLPYDGIVIRRDIREEIPPRKLIRYSMESATESLGMKEGTAVTLFRSKELPEEISWMVPTDNRSDVLRIVDGKKYLSLPKVFSSLEEAEKAMQKLQALPDHTLSVFSTFPTAGALEERPICAMNFPFEEYPLANIKADAKLHSKEDGPYADTITMKVSIANYCQRPQKMLLTVEYDDGLVNSDIPSGSTLYLAFFGRYEYREYMVIGFRPANPEKQGKHEVKFILRNEWGQILNTTTIGILSEMKKTDIRKTTSSGLELRLNVFGVKAKEASNPFQPSNLEPSTIEWNKSCRVAFLVENKSGKEIKNVKLQLLLPPEFSGKDKSKEILSSGKPDSDYRNVFYEVELLGPYSNQGLQIQFPTISKSGYNITGKVFIGDKEDGEISLAIAPETEKKE